MTNRERLKAILDANNDEALERFLTCRVCIFECGSQGCFSHECLEGVKEWLEREVVE